MAKQNKMIPTDGQYLGSVVSEIRELLNKSRQNVAIQVNQELLSTYWHIGEIIVRYEQNEQVRAAYGDATLRQLSKALTKITYTVKSHRLGYLSYRHLSMIQQL